MHRPSRQGKETDPHHASYLSGTSPPPAERLRSHTEQEDFQARSCRPAESVAEAAPAGETTPGAGTLADEQAKGAAYVTGTAGPFNTPAPVTPAAKQRPYNSIPLHKGPRQAEEQPGEVRQRGCGPGDGAARHCRGRLHPRPRVAAIPGGNSSLHAIPATPPRPPTPTPTLNSQGKRANDPVTFATGNGTPVTADGHARPRDDQMRLVAVQRPQPGLPRLHAGRRGAWRVPARAPASTRLRMVRGVTAPLARPSTRPTRPQTGTMTLSKRISTSQGRRLWRASGSGPR